MGSVSRRHLSMPAPAAQYTAEAPTAAAPTPAPICTHAGASTAVSKTVFHVKYMLSSTLRLVVAFLAEEATLVNEPLMEQFPQLPSTKTEQQKCG